MTTISGAVIPDECMELPIVFLHGFLGTRGDWDPVRSYLRGFRCLAFDLPGHGRAPFAERFDLEVNAEQFVLVGYSMGGRLALDYAAKHPGRVAKLILLSAHPGLKTEEEKRERFEIDAQWAKLLLELPIDEFLSRWYDQSLFHPFRPDLKVRRKQNKEWLAAALIHYSLSKQPLYDTSSSHVLVGERDLKFRTLYPNCTVIPNAGHMAHLENPEAVAEEIKRLL